MFCDILLPDGSPSYADPRWVLKRALGRAAELGFTFYTHPEIEFFLLKEKPKPGERPRPIDSGGYFDHTPHSIAHDFRQIIIMMLEPWASRWSTATTRAPPASRRSTCATRTR